MPDSPAYLLLLASGIERQRFADYVSALSPMLHPLGGRHLAMAPAPLLEQFGHNEAPPSVLLSHWPSLDTLRAFWDSPQYKSLAKLRRGSGELLAVALEVPTLAATNDQPDAVLAIFLGAGPSPALLEAAGARALTLVRERQVEPLEGNWRHGDVAIYAWPSAQSARQQLVTFSSGQRGRALLVPALSLTRNTVRQADATGVVSSVAA